MKNRKYVKNKKNGGIVPTVPDIRLEWIETKCGNCLECRKQKANSWRVRLLEDIKTNTNGKFITLTLSNESISDLLQEEITRTNKETGELTKITIGNLSGYDRDNTIATKAVRLFTERWRKLYKTSIRHWLITELGHEGTENIHLHGIMWTNEHIDEIRRIWKYGWIWPRPKQKVKTWVNGQTINYMMKYVTKMDTKHKEYKPIILCSPGIGKNYIDTKAATQNIFNGKNTNETYRTSTGHKVALPAYYRNKIYTEADKESLWIQKLDTNIKWIGGEKVDIRNQKALEKTLQWHRQKNHQLGYGGPTNENRKEHEELKREALLQKRITREK